MQNIVFYCHNVLGLGHIVRSHSIARHIATHKHCTCYMLTGCRFLSSLVIDPAVNIWKLPAVRLIEGRFEAVDGDAGDIISKRSELILDFMRKLEPAVLIMDHLGLGLGGELLPSLLAAEDEGWKTRFIWGFRDVSASPDRANSVLRPPKNPKILKAMHRIDCAMLYTDSRWVGGLDSYQDYPVPQRIEYVGVVADNLQVDPPAKGAKGPLITALAGGGTGGLELFSALLEIFVEQKLPENTCLRIVSGPFGNLQYLQGLIKDAKNYENIQIWDKGSVQKALQGASLAVSRVGYNTAYALVQTRLPLIFVPLTANEGEQYYRASKLSAIDNIWMVDEQDIAYKQKLAATINTALQVEPQARNLPFAVNGAQKAADFILEQARQVDSQLP